tara:strand:+ start:1266 stop:1769 length:504 start_codon:yes stop_codon:yes gene_type:complete
MSCGVCLTNNGKVTEINISDNWSIDYYVKKHGYILYSNCGFNDSKDNKIILFAKKSGKAGTENTHELPPPLDTSLFYDDIYVFKTTCGDLSPLSLTKYEFRRIYMNAFKGFRNIDDTESERSEDESSIGSLCDFIVDDDEEIEYYDTDSEKDSDEDSNEDSDDEEIS